MKTKIGYANHVFSEDEISSVSVNYVIPDDKKDIKPFVTIEDESSHIIISSREQFEQLKALVNNALSEIGK